MDFFLWTSDTQVWKAAIWGGQMSEDKSVGYASISPGLCVVSRLRREEPCSVGKVIELRPASGQVPNEQIAYADGTNLRDDSSEPLPVAN